MIWNEYSNLVFIRKPEISFLDNSKIIHKVTRDCSIIMSGRVWRYQTGVIRIRKSKKNRQHNGQKKNDKMTNNDIQNRKLNIEQHEPHENRMWTQVLRKGEKLLLHSCYSSYKYGDKPWRIKGSGSAPDKWNIYDTDVP